MSTPPREITHSRGLVNWLAAGPRSIVLTTYQTNRLFLIGVKPDGTLSVLSGDHQRHPQLHPLWEPNFISALEPENLMPSVD